MRITLMTVGKTREGWVGEGLGLYASRLSHYTDFSVREIPSLRVTASVSKDEIVRREGGLIMDLLSPSDYVVLLDERGEERTSSAFSAWLQKRMAAGRNMVFVVGGAYGFSPAVYGRADSMMSLSKMTFPHQMVRTVFAEQLYRAFTIIKGEPYHHE